MKRIAILTSLALMITLGLHAQTLRGRVVDDSTGTGLPDASVILSGTSKGTTSGGDGIFALVLPADGKKHTLTISHAGYTTLTIPISDTTPGVVVRLRRSAAALEDVVVIGYQTVRRRDVLASVSSIGAKDLKDIPINSASEALAGRLAGVQVTGSEGSPNAQVIIRVRGGGSITQNNSPLYVVDGIQVDNALNFISPQDIASIDVLKDAASTAIYGARGANGVVIITTKGGRNTGGRTSIAYNGFVGFNKLAKELPVLSPYDFMYYQYERAQLTGDSSGITPYGYSWDTVQKYKTVQPFDWQKQLFGRSAFQMTNNVSITGGTDQTQYNLSLTDNRSDGVMLLSDFDRKLINFRLDHQASKILRVGFNTRYNNTVVDGAGTSNTGSSSLNFLREVVRYQPFLLPGQTSNTFDANYYTETNANGLNLVNPVLLNQQQYRRSNTNVLDFTGYANLTLTKFLSFRSTFGYDDNSMRQDAFDDTLTNNSKSNGAGMPIAGINTTDIQTLDNSNVFTFTNSAMRGDWKDKHAITLIAGEETYQTHEKDGYVETRFFPLGTTSSAALGNMNLGTPPNTSLAEPKPTTTDVTIRLLSFFTRLSYGYDNRYLAYLSFRADGSSLFASGHQWGYFPAATVAWRVSQEKFMQNIGWFNDLKIRASYGTAGNNRISPYLYTSTFSTVQDGLGNNLITAFQAPNLPNGNLKWETTISRNLGLDATLFNNRIGVVVDVYSNKTSNLLINNAIPSNTGYTTQQQNVGSTTNRGAEAQLSATILTHHTFQWTAAFNISFNQNRVTSLGGQQSFLFNSGWAGGNNPADYIVKVGQPVGSMWGLKTAGFYKTSDFNYNSGTSVYTLKSGVPNDASITASTPMPGSLKYQGLNGDTIVTANDRTVIGHALPKFFGGLTQTFIYKGFDASIFINFSYGNQVYNYNKLEFSSGYTPGANLMGFMQHRWHTVDGNGNVIEGLNASGQVTGIAPAALDAVNAGAKYWIPLVGSSSTTFMPQSWAVEDASFIRINNITLGYTLPAAVVRKLKIARLRIYATVNNVAVITGYSGYDPEVSDRISTPITPGVDYSAYPRSRSYVAGINVNF
ncbi:SusC/RagA family TonB-linked outer membrane protein [Puia dinghuensis]|uniref:SusC/RagA family TonB-linked outer membrane protein n=1 Tax=Puia dinghuensis TaxID=1792502 RepID=A0A8J2UD17_9BACT|nr:TonB-dependent receptor [Puia dinghuensis]GGA99099.1 SusC/RagA family TonB-linked outer membrane protein [Puia dinghuensis]